jgi:hypothetical protein
MLQQPAAEPCTAAPCSSSLLQKLRQSPQRPSQAWSRYPTEPEEADELSRVGAEIAASSVVSIEIGTVLLGFAAYRIHDPEHGA